MKSISYTYLLAFLSGFAMPALCIAQELNYEGTKEKIYLQTNHAFFKPGETLFYKIYLVNARDQKPSRQSAAVHVELISPSGNLLKKLTHKVSDGYAEGSYDFTELAPGGIYKIKAYTTWMQNENDRTFFLKELTLQKVISPRILMKLDFPEKGYGAGDEVNANFSMRNLNDQPIRNHQGKLTASVAGEIIASNIFTTDTEGKARVKFSLPKKLNSNDALLNITIQYDSYTEAISRSIPIVLNRIDLQFMPEGGSLVAGLPTHIAFKALDENGKPADIKGEVMDSKGNKIINFKSFHFGMGRFPFTPMPGESYKARILSPANISQEFELPGSNSKGVVMNLSRSNGKIQVKLSTTVPGKLLLTGKSRNTVYYSQAISLPSTGAMLQIDEKLFPTGIAQFTLYSKENLPLAERILFLNENKNLQVRVKTDKSRYLPREKVRLFIETLDENGEPVPSNLSLAVVDDKLWSFADDKQDHILSWLLMSSELTGKIEEPQFYFRKEEPKAAAALDLLMLTHGYRYFDFIPYVAKEGRLKFSPDQENIVSGMIVDENKNPVSARLYLINTVKGGKAVSFKTTNDGLFFFSGLIPNSSYYLFAQALNKKTKVSIELIHQGIGYNPLQAGENRVFLAKTPQFLNQEMGIPQNQLQPMAPMVVPAFANNFEKKIKPGNLDEVVVTAFGTKSKKDMSYSIVRVEAKELLNLVERALQGKIAGLNIVGTANAGGASTVTLRGSRTISGGNNPLIVVDGVPVHHSRLNAFNPGDIESVTVLKDAAATTIYGYIAANGMIMIETKKFRNEKIRFNFSNPYYYASKSINVSGTVYAVARRFYAPKYTSLQPDERTDFRETIYWNPVVQTGKDGKAELEYFNSDATTTFRVITEGIGYNGLAGRLETTYTTRNAMSVDAKIPPNLTVGDKALVPLVIKNNSIRQLVLEIDLVVPTGIRTGVFDRTLVLEPDSSRQLLVPIEALIRIQDKMQFVIKGRHEKETLTLPLVAADKGFPVNLSFSGSQTARHDFTIDKTIPGTLKASLKLFKSLEGQLLDGIESMLREPHGCFEQTSSCTYPNIYVLKYLRESGKSNPVIEKKAMEYIEKGYQRLVGYETKQDGFEWFGNTPPHEALTAYGLLEFTDMQEFIDVDKQMMARTKKFLLSRRDGLGSFNLASGGYDRFASVPGKIAHIYIVYALTQAGLGKEIELEYQAALKKAIESNDGYQMAMMALAASNMKQEKDYEKLMSLLHSNYLKSGLSSETSVVNSRDVSLRVETQALYALALMRKSSPDLEMIGRLITSILAEKTYYGYGATQATVLALQAIVHYSKLTGSLNDTDMDFTMNDKPVGDYQEITGGLREGRNKIGIRYATEKNNIPYSFELSYSTLTPPNSDKSVLRLSTGIKEQVSAVGETVRMEIVVRNVQSQLQPMAVAKIGIPAGLAVQPWQLKEIMEKNQVAYYEIFDNYLVLYWMGFAPNETKKIHLDLKAEIGGNYKAKASNVYLYYTPEHKFWNDGTEVRVEAR